MNDLLQHETLQALDATLRDGEARLHDSGASLAEKLSAVREAFEALAQNVEAEGAGAEAYAASARQCFDAVKAFLAERLGGGEALTQRITELEEVLAQKDKALEAAEEQARQLAGQGAATEDAQKQVGALEQQLVDVRAALDEEKTRAADAARQLEEQDRQGRDASTEADRLRQALEDSKAEKDTLEKESGELRAQAAQLESELEPLRKELEALRAQAASAPSLEELEELRRQLQAEKTRADNLDGRLKEEMAKGIKSVLAQQLAEALRDAEQAQDRLRAVELELAHVREGAAAAEEPSREKPDLAEAALDMPQGDADRVLAAAGTLSGGKRRAIGDLLVSAGIVNAQQIAEAMEEQRSNPNHHLGQILVEKGYAEEEAVAQALACHCGARFVRLEENSVAPGAAALITERLAKQHTCVPVSADEGTLVVAMANPLDLVAIEDVERATNRKVEVVVSTAADIQRAVERYYWEPE